MAYIPSRELVEGVVGGDVRSIARLLTRAESGVDEARAALDTIFARAGRAHVLGITGVPGSGKSTLVAKLAAAIRASGRKVGIVAIDPSSPFSGGAISVIASAWAISRAIRACSCAAWPRAARWAAWRAGRWKPSTCSTRRATRS
jgi:energy-coupling factor transporter ATP-binding protein EcfA2